MAIFRPPLSNRRPHGAGFLVGHFVGSGEFMRLSYRAEGVHSQAARADLPSGQGEGCTLGGGSRVGWQPCAPRYGGFAEGAGPVSSPSPCEYALFSTGEG